MQPAGKTVGTIPIDRWYLVYVILLLQGLGNLYPWNVFITAAQYFSNRFCGTQYQGNFENFFSITNTLSQTIGLALSILYQERFALKTKVLWPLLCYCVVFALTTSFVLFSMDGVLLFWLTLLSTCLCGFFGAFLSAGLFGLGAILPPQYTGALMTGQGLAGLSVSVSSLLTTYVAGSTTSCSPDSIDGTGDTVFSSCNTDYIDYGAFAYFLMATIVLFMCMILFILLERLPFTQHYMLQESMSGKQYRTSLLEDYDENPFEISDESGMERESSYEYSPMQNQPKSKNVMTSMEDVISDSHQPSINFAKIWFVVKEIKVIAFAVIATFGVTIGIFPSLIVLLESTSKCVSTSRASNDLFIPFFFCSFNLFDFLGRLTAGTIKTNFSKNQILATSLSRIVFFPLFLLCNISNSQLPVVFNHDAFPIVFMILFAYSNGFVASICMMTSPSLVSLENMALAGTVMIFSLTFGLLLGASLSFVTVFISQGKI